MAKGSSAGEIGTRSNHKNDICQCMAENPKSLMDSMRIIIASSGRSKQKILTKDQEL